MAKSKAPVDRAYENHGEDSEAPSQSKGTFMQVGTYAPEHPAVSVNQKTGKGPSGEPGS